MRRWRTVSVIATLASVASCGGSSGSYSTGGDGGGGGGGGGAAGTVTLGPGIQYVSGHNGTMNPAVDTIVAGSTVTWTWTGGLPHGVRSVGTPAFTSSPTHTGSGTYVATFTTPGTYKYDCSVHGGAMTGTIVVLPSASPTSNGAYDAAATADLRMAGLPGGPPDIVLHAGHLTLNASNQNADRVERPASIAYLTPELDR